MLIKIMINGKIIAFRKVETGLIDDTPVDKGGHFLTDDITVWHWH